jgi:hypothetical protein
MAKQRRNKRIVIKVVERKLGKEKAWGLQYPGEHLIEIDPRQNAKEYFGTCIHETLHELLPNRSENFIIKAEITLLEVLWKMGYRKVILK